MKYLSILLLFLVSHLSFASHADKYEMRAVWLTTIGGIDWPRSYDADIQKKELCNTLDLLQQAGINTVLIQTRVRATTIYPSALEPWDACMTGTQGKSPGYDALQLVVDECHARGMQCHAWVVTIPIGKWSKLGCAQLRKKHPKMVIKIGDEGYLNPESELTADYLSAICREIVSNYDVDGIHLDYIRYPETWKWPTRNRAQAKQKGRSHITGIVKKIYQAVKSEKPWVMLSCSPIGKYDDLTRYRSMGWNARTTVCQDAQAWLREGWMDAIMPMMYFRDNNFFPFAIDWQEHAYGRIVAPGLGIYFLDPKEGRWTLDVVQRQLHVLRQLGLGHTFFRSKFFTDNTKGIYDFSRQFDATPALVPPMTWANKPRPSAPTQLTMKDGCLSWQGAKANNDSPHLLYNIYASDTYPVDTDDPSNLAVVRTAKTSLQLPNDAEQYFAVTAIDRYGQESRPCQLPAQMPHPYKRPVMAISNGVPILLHQDLSTLDADYFIIEDMQGQQVAMQRFNRKSLDVKALPDGVYQYRSLGKKGVSHRLGFFSVKR